MNKSIWYTKLDEDTRNTYNMIERKWNDLVLKGDDFQHLEEEIASNLSFHNKLKRSIRHAELIGKDPHVADVEYCKTSLDQAESAAVEFTKKAMREDPSKIARLSKIVEGDTPAAVQYSKPALVTGKILLLFIESKGRIPSSRAELLKSVPDEYRLDVDSQISTLKGKFLTRGLSAYGLAEAIQDKRGKKS